VGSGVADVAGVGLLGRSLRMVSGVDVGLKISKTLLKLPKNAARDVLHASPAGQDGCRSSPASQQAAGAVRERLAHVGLLCVGSTV
jgi:hypothetical protein